MSWNSHECFGDLNTSWYKLRFDASMHDDCLLPQRRFTHTHTHTQALCRRIKAPWNAVVMSQKPSYFLDK